jgi:hypothetical protein
MSARRGRTSECLICPPESAPSWVHVEAR